MTKTYHVFLAQLDGRTYRCSPTLDDTAFDQRMNVLRYKIVCLGMEQPLPTEKYRPIPNRRENPLGTVHAIKIGYPFISSTHLIRMSGSTA